MGTGFEHPHWRRSTAVQQGRDLGVRVDRHKGRCRIVRRQLIRISQASYSAPPWPSASNSSSHHRDLDAVRPWPVSRAASDGAPPANTFRGSDPRRAVDVREAATAFSFPGPDIRRCVGRRVIHALISSGGRKQDLYRHFADDCTGSSSSSHPRMRCARGSWSSTSALSDSCLRSALPSDDSRWPLSFELKGKGN